MPEFPAKKIVFRRICRFHNFGEIIAALLGRGQGDLPDGIAAWMASIQPVDAQPLRLRAIQALDAVFSEDSELRLWQGTEDDDVRRADVEALKALLG